MRPRHSLRAHAKRYHPCHERVEEGHIEDFEEEVDGEGFGPGELLVSRLVVHSRNFAGL